MNPTDYERRANKMSLKLTHRGYAAQSSYRYGFKGPPEIFHILHALRSTVSISEPKLDGDLL